LEERRRTAVSIFVEIERGAKVERWVLFLVLLGSNGGRRENIKR
jgi:hypothetical protein